MWPTSFHGQFVGTVALLPVFPSLALALPPLAFLSFFYEGARNRGGLSEFDC